MLLYLIVALPGLLLGLYAQARVKSAFNKYSQVRTSRNITGAQVARQLLNQRGLHNVGVERSQGFLSDHYDPRSKMLRLSPDVHDGTSVAAAGVAAHEMGHALQDAKGYFPLQIRSALVPAAQFGSSLAPWIFFAGLFLNFESLAWVGLILFSAAVFFTLVTLPVEFDASKRAKELLLENDLLYKDEMGGVNKVLNAAALTYVAAAITAIGTLLYYAFLLLGRRD
jgi:Zn-dependent membrane protease YugP